MLDPRDLRREGSYCEKDQEDVNIIVVIPLMASQQAGKNNQGEVRMTLGSAWFYCNRRWTRTFRVWPRSFPLAIFNHSTIWGDGYLGNN